jgi:hypothetical protein
MTTDSWLSAPFAATGDTERFGAYRERVEALLTAQRGMWKREPGAWTVIPLDRETPLFALVAVDSEGERRGREVIAAFVGPAVGRLADTPLALSSADHADVVLSRHGISNVIPLLRESGKDSATLLTALERLVSVRLTQPEIRREIAAPLPFLLRDYWLALQQHDSVESGRLLTSIEGLGLLSADNLRFLQVDRLAALGRWQELAGLPMFRDLARTRRPRRISEELMEALWRARIASDDGATSADQALDRFAAVGLVEDFASLLRSVDVPNSAGARRLAAVSAVLDANDDRLERLLDAATETERDFIADLRSSRGRGRVGTTARTGPAAIVSLSELLDLEDWEGVFRAAEERPGDPRAAEAAVRAAFETEDPDLSRRAVILLSQVPDEELNPLPGFRRMLREVRTAGLDECPAWSAWLERVGRPEAWDRAADVLRAESANWDIGEFASGSSAEAAGAFLLEGSGNANADQVRLSLDLLCALARNLVTHMTGDPLVQAVMMVVSEQQNPSRQVQEALRGLLEPLLDSGPDGERYAEYVTFLDDVWKKVQSRSTVDWGLDIADLLIAAPCPDPSARVRFVQALVFWALGHRQQLAQRQAVMVNMLADQAGLGVSLEIAPSTPGQGNIWARMLGARVGLYSLLPRAGVRLQERLSELAGGHVAVEQNVDHVATSGLRSLAAHADLMVVDTWHATHSATIAIDAVLPRDRQVLPRGGGVMSFLAALQNRLESDGWLGNST